jgi:hypothetical protein
MKFMMILTQVEEAWKDAPPGAGERVFQQYMELERKLTAEQKLISSTRLRPAVEAKTLRNLPQGERTITEGPWTNTNEVMGGFYILDCVSMEEATEWAKRMPNYGHGSIEVRPIWE